MYIAFSLFSCTASCFTPENEKLKENVINLKLSGLEKKPQNPSDCGIYVIKILISLKLQSNP